jgi:hypothetical protein
MSRSHDPFAASGQYKLSRRAGAVAGIAIGLVIAVVIVVVFAPAPTRSPGVDIAEPLAAGDRRVGRVTYGPVPHDVRCRGYRFDNHTAAMEEVGAADCIRPQAAKADPMPVVELPAEVLQPRRPNRIDAIRESLRR